jgi:hypothetical protein
MAALRDIQKWREERNRKAQEDARAKVAAAVVGGHPEDVPNWDAMIDEAMTKIYLEEHLRDQTTLEHLAGPTARVVHIVLSATDHKALIRYAQRVSLQVSRQVGLDELCAALVRKAI